MAGLGHGIGGIFIDAFANAACMSLSEIFISGERQRARNPISEGERRSRG
jgi:hypothetical protein